MHTLTERLPYCDALSLYRHLRDGGASCLFESNAASDKSSRMSLIGTEPVLELIGKDNNLIVRKLSKRSEVFFEFLREQYAAFLSSDKPDELHFHITKTPFTGAESERLERLNIVQPLRRLLKDFHCGDKNFMGFYGAFSYRFVYQFEDIAHQRPCEEPDFHLFLFDTVLLFNHLTHDLTLYITRPDAAAAARDLGIFSEKIHFFTEKNASTQAEVPTKEPFSVKNLTQSPSDATFKAQVAQGVQLCHEGELLEIVLSRQLTAQVSGDPLALYAQYRRINPSPYLFYMDFRDEVLTGASPELMLRYEAGRATLRPISGTVRRSENPIEDHHLVMQLLNDPKENSELDMLIDLGRNDLARICKPGITIEHYRIVEKYSHVTHTVAQVSGELEERYSGFDALIASLNAGTLTGAPKIAAMQYIEQIEQHTRGYYGGSIGWLLLDGDVNTAITIRTAHIAGGKMSYCTGATLLYQSVPENELEETRIKAGAFMKALEPFVATEKNLA